MRQKVLLLLAAALLIGMFSPLGANLLLEENFDYTAGIQLANSQTVPDATTGWLQNGTTVTNPILVGTSGLSFAGYSGSGIGNSAVLTTTGQDIYKNFSSAISSGSVYGAAMVKVTAVQSTGDYFMHFTANTVTNLYVRVYAKSTTGGFLIGLTKMNETPVNYGTTVFSLDTTYLVVLRYDFVTGTQNDIVYLYVFNATDGIPTSEPVTPVLQQTYANNDASELFRFSLRQGSNTAAPSVTVDGIKAGTTWSDLFPAIMNPVLNVSGVLDEFLTFVGQPSERQSYQLTGTELPVNISVTAPTGFELSLTGDEPYNSTLSIPPVNNAYSGTVYVRFNPASAGPFSGTIVHTCGTATPVNLAVSGEGFQPSGEIVVDHDVLNFNTIAGTPSAVQSYLLQGVDLTDFIYVQTSTPYQIRNALGGSWTDYLELAPDFDGTIEVRFNPTTAGNYDSYAILHYSAGVADVSITLNGTAAVPFQIAADPTTLTFSTTVGTPEIQSYTLQGTNLTEDITVTPPAGCYVSLENREWFTSLTVTNPNTQHTVYVKFDPPSVGTYNGNVANTANGITTNVAITGTGIAPVTPMNIAAGQTITRNLDIMGVLLDLPTDFKADKQTTADTRGTWDAASAVTDRLGGNNLSPSATNGIYNFGAGPQATATDRAVGFLSSGSGTKTGNLYAKITNAGPQTITSFNVSYNAEKYRQGSNAQGFGIKVYYSTDGATWTYAGDPLKAFWSQDANNNGYDNAPGDTQAKSGTVAIDVAPAGHLYLCWSYGVGSLTTTTNAQALAIDDISITALANPITAAPVFDPMPGLMTGPTVVTISCVTPDASIYYTVDDSNPTTLSNPYLMPIQINTTTTLKAIAQAPAHDISPQTAGLYTIPVAVPNIATLRLQTPSTGIPYKLSGEAYLTLKSTTRFAKYLQDATAAILIDDPSHVMSVDYNLGDGITGIIGTLAPYGNMLQFTPILNPGAATSTGHAVTPLQTTLTGLNTTMQGKLVQISNITVDATGDFGITPPATTPATTNYNVTDPSGSGVLRVAYIDLDYVGTAIPTTAKNYIGVVLEYNGTMQFVPRSLAEITEPASIIPPEDVVITIIGNDIQITWTNQPNATAGYKVEYCDTPYGDYDTLTIVNDNSYFGLGEAGLVGTRFYRIRARQ